MISMDQAPPPTTVVIIIHLNKLTLKRENLLGSKGNFYVRKSNLRLKKKKRRIFELFPRIW